MKPKLDSILKFLKANLAFSITSANLILILLLLFSKDPFGIFAKTYESSKPFLKPELSSINKFTIEKTQLSNSKLEFNLKTDSWTVNYQGSEYPADKDRVDSLVKGFKNAKRFTAVSSSKDKNNEFGFNEDEMKIEFFNNNNSIGSFLLGSASKDGNSIHVKWMNESEIYLVEENLKNYTSRGEVNYFLNKKISPPNLNTDDIQSVELASSSNSYLLSKSSAWYVEKPSKGLISNEDVNTTLNKLISMNADELVVDKNSIAGISPLPFEIIFKYKKDQTESIVKIISYGYDKKTNSYYITKDKDPNIYKLSEYSIKSILDWKPDKQIKK
jgi:hypothetical protein